MACNFHATKMIFCKQISSVYRSIYNTSFAVAAFSYTSRMSSWQSPIRKRSHFIVDPLEVQPQLSTLPWGTLPNYKTTSRTREGFSAFWGYLLGTYLSSFSLFLIERYWWPPIRTKLFRRFGDFYFWGNIIRSSCFLETQMRVANTSTGNEMGREKFIT